MVDSGTSAYFREVVKCEEGGGGTYACLCDPGKLSSQAHSTAVESGVGNWHVLRGGKWDDLCDLVIRAAAGMIA